MGQQHAFSSCQAEAPSPSNHQSKQATPETISPSMEEQAARLYDRFAPTYDEGFKQNHRKLYDEVAWELVRDYLKAAPQKGKVFDAGGGTARWAIWIANLRRDLRVVIYDISSKMCAIAQQKIVDGNLHGRVSIKNKEFSKLDESEGPLDFIVAMGSLQYSSEPERVLRRWFRALKPGGGVAILVDSMFARTNWMINHSEIEGALDVLKNKKNIFSFDGEVATTHVFSPDDLREIVSSAGFEVELSAGLLALWQGMDNEKLHQALDDEAEYAKWKNLELSYCKQPSIAGMGRQILVVGRKPGG